MTDRGRRDAPDGVEPMSDASLAYALASTFTPDELDLMGQHLSRRPRGDESAGGSGIDRVVARLGDAITAARELHAAILAAGAHATGCHASPLAHATDCECWCHRHIVTDADGLSAEEA